MLKNTEIKNIVNIIKSNFDPLAIYLFGSYAKGTASFLSDLDLLVIDDHTKLP